MFQVMELRQAESQALLQDESRPVSEQGSSMNPGEPIRRSGVVQHEAAAFSLNLSFEELSGAGLEEPPRPTNNSHWPVSLPVRSLVHIHTISTDMITYTSNVCTLSSPIWTCKINKK